MLTQIKKDKLTLNVFETREEMGNSAGKLAGEKINQVIKEKGMANVIFAAAPSQNETLKALCQENVDWSKVRAFHMDEYLGLPSNSPNLFARYLDDNIFRKVPFAEIYYIGSNPTTSIEKYVELLEKFPPDVVCLGIGENGHIAFNDPHVAKFNDSEKIKKVELDLKCREQQVHDKTFNSLEEVPTHALTLTIPTLIRAKYMICTVPGKSKAWAVERTINDEISEKIPSTILRTHDGVQAFCDADAYSVLKENI